MAHLHKFICVTGGTPKASKETFCSFISTGWVPFLKPNQQCHSIEDRNVVINLKGFYKTFYK